jgi:hypothetical protein
MAERNFDFCETIGRKKRLVSGSWAPNGSSALVSTDVYGYGFSVAYTSTGLFTITFSNTYRRLQSVTATLQLASGDDKYVQVGNYVAASRTLEVRVWDASSAAVADVAANANNRVHFVCVFDDSLQA